jgi:hypothetical protein
MTKPNDLRARVEARIIELVPDWPESLWWCSICENDGDNVNKENCTCRDCGEDGEIEGMQNRLGLPEVLRAMQGVRPDIYGIGADGSFLEKYGMPDQFGYVTDYKLDRHWADQPDDVYRFLADVLGVEDET